MTSSRKTRPGLEEPAPVGEFDFLTDRVVRLADYLEWLGLDPLWDEAAHHRLLRVVFELREITEKALTERAARP